jgi:hypothetical protein
MDMYDFTSRERPAPRKKRYFGMTGSQIAILAGMLVVACIVIAVGGFMALSLSSSAPSSPSQIVSEASPQPTSTPLSTKTPTSTPTPWPTPTPIAGWKKFEGDGAVIWLPETFIGGHPEKDREAILGEIKNLGPNFQKDDPTYWDSKLSALPASIWALDSNLGDTLVYTIMFVYRENLGDMNITLDSYLDKVIENNSANTRLVGREIVTLDQYKAGRLLYEYMIQEEGLSYNGKMAFYVIQLDKTMWTLVYATGKDEYPNRQPTFELSTRSFQAPP